MNESLYKKYVVSQSHRFCNSGTIMEYILSFHNEKSEDWDMRLESFPNLNGMLTRYSVGYCLLPMYKFYYLHYNHSDRVPWVNNEWLPNWGKLTIQKAGLIKSLINYYLYKKKLLIYYLCVKRYNIGEIGLINNIFEFLQS